VQLLAESIQLCVQLGGGQLVALGYCQKFVLFCIQLLAPGALGCFSLGCLALGHPLDCGLEFDAFMPASVVFLSHRLELAHNSGQIVLQTVHSVFQGRLLSLQFFNHIFGRIQCFNFLIVFFC
jgi:hypothetical protein